MSIARALADSSVWDAAGVERFLDEAVIPIRLACLADESYPFPCSLWFRRAGDELLACVQSSAFLAERFRTDDRCGFEVAGDAPPYRGVRGRGRVRIDEGSAATVLPALIDRYLGGGDDPLAHWLLARLDTEVVLRIRPEWLTSWDYSARMRAG